MSKILSNLFRVDKRLNLGHDVIVEMIKSLDTPAKARILDVGCDDGRLLKKINNFLNQGSETELFGLDFREYQDEEIKIDVIDFEHDAFPYETGFFDLVICNQVLEHLKSFMWTLSEIIRTTRVGGHFLLGVPNLASAHNRLLMLFGRQPTTIGLTGPHVRAFTPCALISLLGNRKSMSIISFRGSNFYPFPPGIARYLAKIFPTMAVATFIIIKKKEDVDFINIWKEQKLATNFYLGK